MQICARCTSKQMCIDVCAVRRPRIFRIKMGEKEKRTIRIFSAKEWKSDEFCVLKLNVICCWKCRLHNTCVPAIGDHKNARYSTQHTMHINAVSEEWMQRQKKLLFIHSASLANLRRPEMRLNAHKI